MDENEPTPPADDAETNDVDKNDVEVASGEPSDDAAGTSSEPDVKVAAFSELPDSRPERNGSMERFYDVNIPVWAELGRVEMPIGELMRIDAGTVLRLDRPVSEPVEIVSQGVTLARGEVVVVDDCFAVRIKEIHSSK